MGQLRQRRAAAAWARAAATRRDFGPDTDQVVQVVPDGAAGLKQNLEPLFPRATFTLDICHVVERLWAPSHHFHPEASPGLAACVAEWKGPVYAGGPATADPRLSTDLGAFALVV